MDQSTERGPGAGPPGPYSDARDWMYRTRDPRPKPEFRERIYGNLLTVGYLALVFAVIFGLLLAAIWALGVFPPKSSPPPKGPCNPSYVCTVTIATAGATFPVFGESAYAYASNLVVDTSVGNVSSWNVTGSWNATQVVSLYILTQAQDLSWSTVGGLTPPAFEWSWAPGTSGFIDATVPAGDTYLVWSNTNSADSLVTIGAAILATPSG